MSSSSTSVLLHKTCRSNRKPHTFEPKTKLFDLSHENICHCLSFLDACDVIGIESTCTQLRNIILSGDWCEVLYLHQKWRVVDPKKFRNISNKWFPLFKNLRRIHHLQFTTPENSGLISAQRLFLDLFPTQFERLFEACRLSLEHVEIEFEGATSNRYQMFYKPIKKIKLKNLKQLILRSPHSALYAFKNLRLPKCEIIEANAHLVSGRYGTRVDDDLNIQWVCEMLNKADSLRHLTLSEFSPTNQGAESFMRAILDVVPGNLRSLKMYCPIRTISETVSAALDEEEDTCKCVQCMCEDAYVKSLSRRTRRTHSCFDPFPSLSSSLDVSPRRGTTSLIETGILQHELSLPQETTTSPFLHRVSSVDAENNDSAVAVPGSSLYDVPSSLETFTVASRSFGETLPLSEIAQLLEKFDKIPSRKFDFRFGGVCWIWPLHAGSLKKQLKEAYLCGPHCTDEIKIKVCEGTKIISLPDWSSEIENEIKFENINTVSLVFDDPITMFHQTILNRMQFGQRSDNVKNKANFSSQTKQRDLTVKVWARVEAENLFPHFRALAGLVDAHPDLRHSHIQIRLRLACPRSNKSAYQGLDKARCEMIARSAFTLFCPRIKSAVMM